MTDPLSDPAKPLSEEYLRAVLARVDQATPEPWESREPPRGPMVEDADNRIADFSWGDIGEAQSYLNAEFCAAARTDVPALARECLRLRELLAEAAEAQQEIRLTGAMMANLCHNLSQPSWTFEERHRDDMRELYKRWDAATAKVAAVAARTLARTVAAKGELIPARIKMLRDVTASEPGHVGTARRGKVYHCLVDDNGAVGVLAVKGGDVCLEVKPGDYEVLLWQERRRTRENLLAEVGELRARCKALASEANRLREQLAGAPVAACPRCNQKCRHCGKNYRGRSGRGLCRECHADTAVRDRYPAGKFGGAEAIRASLAKGHLGGGQG